MSDQPNQPSELTTLVVSNPSPEATTDTAEQEAGHHGFDEDLIKKYPRSNRKVVVDIKPYGLVEDNGEQKAQTLHISPHGIEFQGTHEYAQGTLLKIHISLPDYWNRKQRLVEYRRVDTPGTFKVLAKVVKSTDVGKRGKKKLVLVQMVNMDEVDEQVLKSYLQDG